MILLEQENFIGEGANQKCYFHHENDKLCIKIAKPNIKIKKLLNEINYSKRISKRKQKIEYPFFARLHQQVETNLGSGFVYDLIRDESTNNVSKTMADYLMEKDKTFSDEVLEKAFSRLIKMMAKYKVIVKDLYANNICCKILADGSIELVLVDGFGHKDKIPLVDYSSFLSKKKIERRLQRNSFQNLDQQRNFQKKREKYKNL